VADHKFLFVSSQNGVLISDGAQSRELVSESSPMLPASEPKLTHIALVHAQAIKPSCSQDRRPLFPGNSTRASVMRLLGKGDPLQVRDHPLTCPSSRSGTCR
jgi:hypothetical protein